MPAAFSRYLARSRFPSGWTRSRPRRSLARLATRQSVALASIARSSPSRSWEITPPPAWRSISSSRAVCCWARRSTGSSGRLGSWGRGGFPNRAARPVTSSAISGSSRSWAVAGHHARWAPARPSPVRGPVLEALEATGGVRPRPRFRAAVMPGSPHPPAQQRVPGRPAARSSPLPVVSAHRVLPPLVGGDGPGGAGTGPPPDLPGLLLLGLLLLLAL